MKRSGAILSIILILTMLFCQVVYADSLEIESVYPANGATRIQPSGMALKFTFSQSMDDEKAIEDNAARFSIVGADGSEPQFDLICNSKNGGKELWLICKDNLTGSTEYTVTVKPGVKSASNGLTNKEFVSTFTTRNASRDQTVTYVMMILMLVAMFGGSLLAAKKKAEEEDTREKAKLNPYKLAKEKGISIEEAQKIVDKAAAKESKRLAKAKAKQEEALKRRELLSEADIAKIEAQLDTEDRLNGIQRVHQRASIKKAGLAVPKSVIRKNRAKKANKKNKKK